MSCHIIKIKLLRKLKSFHAFRTILYLCVGTNCSISYTFWSHMLIQRHQGDCIKGKRNHKLEVASDFSLLLLWNSSWYGGWIARLRRWLHLGTPFPWTWNSPTGLSPWLGGNILSSVNHILQFSNCVLFKKFEYWSKGDRDSRLPDSRHITWL